MTETCLRVSMKLVTIFFDDDILPIYMMHYNTLLFRRKEGDRMKRIIGVLVSLMMIFALSTCGNRVEQEDLKEISTVETT